MHNRGGGFHPPCLSQLSNILNTKSSSSWPIDTIGNVAPAESRRSLGRLSDPCWLLNLDQIEKDTGYLGEREWVDPASASTSTHNFNTDHVLYSKLRPNLNKVVCPEESGICTTELIRLKPDPKRLNRKFLTYFLRSEYFMGFARQVVAGAKMPRMVMDRFWEFEIPLPPLPEQHRIVEILDQADALRRQRREAGELSKRILPALFREMFGDPNRNDRNWPTNDFEATFEDVSRLGNKIPRSEYLPEGEVPVIDQGQEEVAGFWNNQSDKYRGNLPVILFGDHTRIFKLIEHPFCIGADGVRLLNPRKMNPHFAYSMLSMLEIPSRGYSRHFKELKGLFYINPPVDLQERFGKVLVQMRKTAQITSTSAATLETLFQTLLHRAFDGSLTAKWREGQSKELLQEM